MVLSSGEIVSIGSGIQSQVGGVSLVRSTLKKAEELVTITIPEAVIKYHKISKRDKFIVPEGLPEYYIEQISEKEKQKREEVKKFLSRFKFVNIVIPSLDEFYLNDCYMIDYIFAPVRNKGKGTSAIKKLVEKSAFDKKIAGKIIVDLKKINEEPSACLFFYKLGFRFIEAEKNEIIQNCLSQKNPNSVPDVVGYMYLPKESVHRLLMYKMMM